MTQGKLKLGNYCNEGEPLCEKFSSEIPSSTINHSYVNSSHSSHETFLWETQSWGLNAWRSNIQIFDLTGMKTWRHWPWCARQDFEVRRYCDGTLLSKDAHGPLEDPLGWFPLYIRTVENTWKVFLHLKEQQLSCLKMGMFHAFLQVSIIWSLLVYSW